MPKMARKLFQAEYELIYLTLPTKRFGNFRLGYNFFSFSFFIYLANEPIKWRDIINFSSVQAWQNLKEILN